MWFLHACLRVRVCLRVCVQQLLIQRNMLTFIHSVKTVANTCMTHLLVTGQRCEWRGAGVAVGATLPFPWPQSVMGTLPGCPALRLRGLPQLPRCEGEVMEHPYRDLTHTLILTGANHCHLYGLVWAGFWVLLHPDSHMHMQMRWNCHLQQE